MVLEKKINGIEVTLDTDVDGAGESSPDRVSGCWLNFKDYSGSLAFALANGGLLDSEQNLLKISSPDLEAIEGWALARGY
jgi:hypothetical protein